MAIRLRVVLLLLALALAMVADSSPTFDTTFGITTKASFNGDGGLSAMLSDGKVGDFIDEAEEMMMESETTRRTRRTLAGQQRHISYDAMRKGSVPCNRRGNSYYACTAHGRANPYQRGCTRISRCARNGR